MASTLSSPALSTSPLPSSVYELAPKVNRLLFTYPPFSKTSFMQPVQHTELKQLAPSHIPVSNSMKVNQKEALEIAKALFKLKKPLHFHYYQEQARGWDIISRRKP